MLVVLIAKLNRNEHEVSLATIITLSEQSEHFSGALQINSLPESNSLNSQTKILPGRISNILPCTGRHNLPQQSPLKVQTGQ